MKNIRVAILDTGIAEEIIDKRIKYKVQLYFDYYYEKIVSNEVTADYNGHGTKCVNTIWKTFPYVDIYVIKILNISGFANSIVFKEALRFVNQLEVDIISICASFVISDIDKDIEFLCEDIVKKDKMIIASVENGKETSAIANYKSVIGVIGGIMKDSDFCYSKGADIQMQCSASPIILPGVRGIRDTFQGNSKATAIATGILAEVLFQNKKKKDNISSILQEKASSYQFYESSIDLSLDKILYQVFDEKKELYYIENDIMYHQFIFLLCEFYMCENPNKIRFVNLIMYKNGRLGRHLEDLLLLIEERFKMSIGIVDIQDLQWAYLFYEKHLR